MIQQLVFTKVLNRVWIGSLLTGVYSSLVVLNEVLGYGGLTNFPGGLEAALTFAMGMLLMFRTNKAYERWWEARILWGTLVNVSRNLAVKVKEMVRPDAATLAEVQTLITGFSHALKDHLRDEVELARIKGFHEINSAPEHVPSFLASRVYSLMASWRREGRISPEELYVLDREARVLLDVCGGCERIKNTLMSQSWRTFSVQSLAVYLLLLPWGLVDVFGVWSIPLASIVTYFVVGGECIARYVEEPFGRNEDHLDLDSICRAIDTSVSEILRPVAEPSVS